MADNPLPMTAGGGSAAEPVLTRSTTHAGQLQGSSATDQLLSVPPPILHLLVRAAPFIRSCTQVTRALTWQHSNRWASWLVLAVWWTVCLFGPQIARFGFNVVGVALLGLGWLIKQSQKKSRDGSLTTAIQNSNKKASSSPVISTMPDLDHKYNAAMTPARLPILLDDARQLADALHVLSAQVFIPAERLFLWRDTQTNALVLSYLVTSYPGYIVVTYYLGVRYVILIVGTVALIWNAPWFSHVRRGVLQSLALRTYLKLSASILLGGGRDCILYLNRSARIRALLLKDARGPPADISDSPPLQLQTQTLGTTASPVSPAKNVFGGFGADLSTDQSVIFTFTVFENQRWWVGLDWTQALLPNERPPWCDHSLHSVPPPSSFTLPSPQVTFSPAPTKTDPDAQLKRISQWQWADADWHVRPDSHSQVPVQASSAATADLSSSATATSAANNIASIQADSATSPSKLAAIAPPSAAAFTDWARNKVVQASQTARKGSDAGTTSSSKASVAHFRKSSWMPFGEDETPKAGPQTSHVDPTLPKAASSSDEFQQEWQADSSGWQYGDNSWERFSPRGGMGKYTRRRAWLRRARVAEIVETVSGSDYNENLRRRSPNDGSEM